MFDHLGVLRKFDNANQILGEFYGVRLEYYHKRKAFLEGMLGADAQKLSNQARFIIEKCEGSLVVENKKKKVMIAELQRKGYDPDPVKRWKKTQEEEALSETESDSDADLGEEAKHEVNSSPAFNCRTKCAHYLSSALQQMPQCDVIENIPEE